MQGRTLLPVSPFVIAIIMMMMVIVMVIVMIHCTEADLGVFSKTRHWHGMIHVHMGSSLQQQI